MKKELKIEFQNVAFCMCTQQNKLLYQGKQQFLINLMIDDDFIHGKSEPII